MSISSTPQLFRLGTIRFRGAYQTVAGAIAICEDGSPIADAPGYALVFPEKATPVEVQTGQWWNLHGKVVASKYSANGFTVHEKRLTVAAAEIIRPSGSHIVQLLSKSPDFPGVGEATAQKLWSAYGRDLYAYLDQADYAALDCVVGAKLAATILDGWSKFGASDTIKWLQDTGIDLRLSRKVLRIHGAAARERIAEDPYRLLSLGMAWNAVEQLARYHFGLGNDDPRRLAAAVESVMFDALGDGHTCGTLTSVLSAVGRLIGHELAGVAVELALQSKLIVRRETAHGSVLLQGLGASLIESTIAAAVRARLAMPPVCPPARVEALLDQYQSRERTVMANPSFSLNAAQRLAVHACAAHGIALITGGAGVGKTTVLRAVCEVLEALEYIPVLVALAGRAAMRMRESTGRDTATIAGFIQNIGRARMPSKPVLVVDEASMLDVLLAFRLVREIPDDCRIVLIGDPAQLPPVGPGLTLHALAGCDTIPCVELSEVLRFGSVIAAAAGAIRRGIWPGFPGDPAVEFAFLPCEAVDVPDLVLALYLRNPTDTQVLTMTKDRGPASAKVINARIQQALCGDRGSPTALARSPLRVWNDENGRLEYTGLRLGDPIICTKNRWNEGLQNGSLGRIVRFCVQVPGLAAADRSGPHEQILAWVLWDDGVERPLTASTLDTLELAYAVTVHKAQGSQFPRVIVPVLPGRLLDRTMLYTAATRAIRQVLLVGDEAAARRAVENEPASSQRMVMLPELLMGLHDGL